MAHLRTQIRNKVLAMLTNLATTGANAFADRKEFLPDAKLPAILVMNDNDQVATRTIGSQAAPHARTEGHTLALKLQAVAKAVTGLDDTLDQICLEVEKAIMADIFLAGLTVDARLMSTVYTLDATGEKPAGIAEMVFEFDYWVQNTAPDTVA